MAYSNRQHAYHTQHSLFYIFIDHEMVYVRLLTFMKHAFSERYSVCVCVLCMAIVISIFFFFCHHHAFQYLWIQIDVHVFTVRVCRNNRNSSNPSTSMRHIQSCLFIFEFTIENCSIHLYFFFSFGINQSNIELTSIRHDIIINMKRI